MKNQGNLINWSNLIQDHFTHKPTRKLYDDVDKTYSGLTNILSKRLEDEEKADTEKVRSINGFYEEGDEMEVI